jgi:hypothetical protein
MASGPQSRSGGAKSALEMDFTKFFSSMKFAALPDMEAFLAAGDDAEQHGRTDRGDAGARIR